MRMPVPYGASKRYWRHVCPSGGGGGGVDWYEAINKMNEGFWLGEAMEGILSFRSFFSLLKMLK